MTLFPSIVLFDSRITECVDVKFFSLLATLAVYGKLPSLLTSRHGVLLQEETHGSRACW